MNNNIKDIYSLSKVLFPIHRSLMGKNNLKTLEIIKSIIPSLKIKFFRSGKKSFDWVVPKEWNLKEAYIADMEGNKIIDIVNNNLHVVQYSISVNKTLSFRELKDNLYFIKSSPNAIPYITSYYKKKWGFCISYNQYKKLSKLKNLKIKISSNFKNNKMHYGEMIIKGKSNKEILFTTYICHPSMANNEVSGPALLTYLSKWILSNNNYYSYRILFIPESIGTISYISDNLKILKKKVVAGLVVTCVGTNHSLSYIKTKNDNSLTNKVLIHYLKKNRKKKIFDYSHKGSDERHYNSPNISIDIGSLMSNKYGTYKEYHTSLDNLKFISNKGLNFMYHHYMEVIKLFEINITYQSNIFCEPFLSKRNLYPTLSKNYRSKEYKFSINLLNVLDYCDSKNDLIDISNTLKLDIEQVYEYIKILKSNNLISISNEQKNYN